ncbi:MAG: FAD-binding oxidoreductase, partial [Thermomicrobiales bacterium]|nr:FAD-binding oxidoreductase [Thermomicrobiales bacterium]
METRTNELQNQVGGVVLSPDDAGYAEEIAGFNLAVQHRPDIVVGIESAQDAQAAIRYAATNHLQITVQSTGHGAHAPVTSGMMISTRRLNDVRIDPVARTARVGAGARWGAVIDTAGEHGLAPITGSSPTVGVAGYLLGGGIGPLNRSHGFSSDYLAQVTLVNGRGEIVIVNRSQRPDLLWALRGGKHGFGVVTEMVVQLVELSSLYAGFLMFAEEHIETALRSWVDWTATADPRVTTSVAIIDFPPFEFIPEVLRGRKMLTLRFAFPGDPDMGEQHAAPLRASAPVFIDTIAEMPATEMARIHNEPVDPLPMSVGGRLLTHIDQELASILLRNAGAGQHPPVMVTEIRHLGAASSRDVPGGSAAGGRRA